MMSGFIQNISTQGLQSDEKELWYSADAYNIHL